MLPFRPLIALITALSLLAALPVAGAEAKSRPSKSKTTKLHKATKKKKARKKKARKRRKPAAMAPASEATGDGRIGEVTEVDGNTVTVTLSRGGSVSADVTEETEGACPSVDEELEDDDFDDEAFDDDPLIDDDSDFRSARSDGSCQAVVGVLVYGLEVEEGIFGVLDLTA